MKVKELIAQLQTFDQEKDIWIQYDTFFPQEPEFEICPENRAYGECKAGDYYHRT